MQSSGPLAGISNDGVTQGHLRQLWQWLHMLCGTWHVAVLGSCFPSLLRVNSHLHGCGGSCRSAQQESYSSADGIIMYLSLSVLGVSSANSPISRFRHNLSSTCQAPGKRHKDVLAVGRVASLHFVNVSGTTVEPAFLFPLIISSSRSAQNSTDFLHSLGTSLLFLPQACHTLSLLHTHLVTQFRHTDQLGKS